jgi:hypothetical protein
VSQQQQQQQQRAQDKCNLRHHDWAQNIKEPEWVWKMKEHYARTGAYRPEDLRRLLGDPTKGVEMGAGASISNCFHQQESKR